MNNEKFNALWASFDKDEWPVLLDYSVTNNTDKNTIIVEITCHVPTKLSWFEGHFPEQPVLPGVVQTHWAGELSTALFPIDDFRQVNGLKFKSMILPDTNITLSLVFNAEKKSVDFRYLSSRKKSLQNENPNETFTSGCLLFK